MLARFDPLADLDRSWGELIGALSRRSPLSMPADLYRHNGEWVAKFDLPGVAPASIDLTVERNVLRVTAQRDWRPDEGDLVLVAERPRGSFTRQLVLGDDIDTSAVRATYTDGVLTITLPEAEAAKPRKVAVAVQAQGPAQVTAA